MEAIRNNISVVAWRLLRFNAVMEPLSRITKSIKITERDEIIANYLEIYN